MRRCEDEKMFYRPPLLEEPCAQTLSGKKRLVKDFFMGWDSRPGLGSIDISCLRPQFADGCAREFRQTVRGPGVKAIQTSMG